MIYYYIKYFVVPIAILTILVFSWWLVRQTKGGMPDIPESECYYESHGWEPCACYDCEAKRIINSTKRTPNFVKYKDEEPKW